MGRHSFPSDVGFLLTVHPYCCKNLTFFVLLQSVSAGYRNSEAESEEEEEEEYNNDVNWRVEEQVDYMDGEYGELTWFAAGVRVGVGIGLGICLGVGIGVGVLLRSYTAATRNFRRQLL